MISNGLFLEYQVLDNQHQMNTSINMDRALDAQRSTGAATPLRQWLAHMPTLRFTDRRMRRVTV